MVGGLRSPSWAYATPRPSNQKLQQWPGQLLVKRESSRRTEKSSTTVALKLSEALRRYKRDVSPTKAGQRWEELRLDKFDRDLEWVGELMDSITSEQVAQWRDARLKKVKTATVRREMTLLGSENFFHSHRVCV